MWDETATSMLWKEYENLLQDFRNPKMKKSVTYGIKLQNHYKKQDIVSY